MQGIVSPRSRLSAGVLGGSVLAQGFGFRNKLRLGFA